jgi:hypothetical protein
MKPSDKQPKPDFNAGQRLLTAGMGRPMARLKQELNAGWLRISILDTMPISGLLMNMAFQTPGSFT